MSLDLHPSAISTLYDFFSEGRARYGDLEFGIDAFVEHVGAICARRAEEAELAEDFVASLHGIDLYLACGCVLQCATAWQMLEACFHDYITRLAASVARTLDEAIDLTQSVVVDLFLPDRSGRSRIGSYDGRSSLATWLRVLVCHRAINDRKRHRRDVESFDPAALDAADELAVTRLDATVRAHRYADAAGNALRHAFANLNERERLVLLLRYGRMQQVQEIAAALSVHPSNVTRQIDRVCYRLRTNVIGALRDDYGLSNGAVEECLADLLENPSHEILSLLEPAAGRSQRAQ